MPSRTSWLQGIVAVIALAVGVGVLVLLRALGEPPGKRAAVDRRVAVETVTVERDEHQLELHTEGTLTPRRVLQLRPQVGGKLVWVSPDLEIGTSVDEGQPLLRIEQRDYRSALRRAQAALAQAEAALEIERGRQIIARRELSLLEDQLEDMDEAARARALRKPDLRRAQAEVKSARSAVAEAAANLERTTLRAPFDAYVRDEAVEHGSLVTAGEPVAALVGTDVFWVEVAVPLDQLRYIDVPRGGEERGTPVRIVQRVGDQFVERTGRVEKLLGDLEEQSRLAQLLVRVDDPLGRRAAAMEPGQVTGQLLVGAFVQVVLETDERARLVEIPGEALREGDVAYVYDDGVLDIRPLRIAWHQDDSVMVREGLSDGDRVIISPLSRAIQGMKLRPVERVTVNP